MHYKYTNEDIDFLRKNYPVGNWNEIHERFKGVSDSSIHHKCSRLGIKFDIKFKRKFDNTISRKRWTDEEINILKQNYSIVPIDVMMQLLPNRNKNMITNQAISLHLVSYHNINSKWTNDEIQYLKNNWSILPDKLIAKDLEKSFYAVKAKRQKLGLFRQDKNSNSYPTLSKYLRGHNQKWKLDSMKASDYKCVLTGSKQFEIHHLYGVSNMISDILNKYNYYKDKSFEEYTKEDLSFILDKFLIEQSKYPLGECIDKQLHVLFHSMYGQYYNTPEQWNQFKNDYKNGRYEDIA